MIFVTPVLSYTAQDLLFQIMTAFLQAVDKLNNTKLLVLIIKDECL